MDWYLPNVAAAASVLRKDIGSYVQRHAQEGSDLVGAELICAELINNAIENSDSPVWVSLDWGARRPVLAVNDLGTGFQLPGDIAMPSADSIGGRGLAIVTHLTDQLSVAAKAAGGSRVTATLPVERPPSASFDPEPMTVDWMLPTLEEADETGGFGRESFLRALVVQMASVLENEAGPAAAEAMVAAVGTGVGMKMEEAFRSKRDLLDGPLDVDSIAELLVHLKRRIDGDFFVIEANERRIVLGNRRCPFGDAVRQAPSLCRMTSSVFGGIAARSSGGSAVHLEERIAVGDPQCKVTIWLEQPPIEIEPEIHFYGRMRPEDG